MTFFILQLLAEIQDGYTHPRGYSNQRVLAVGLLSTDAYEGKALVALLVNATK